MEAPDSTLSPQSNEEKHRQKRRVVRRLFGLGASQCSETSEQQPSTSIYLSRLEIIPGGTIAVGDQDVEVGYKGPAINWIEYEGALEISEAINKVLNRDKESMVRIVPSPLYEERAKFKNVYLPRKYRLRDKLDLVLDKLSFPSGRSGPDYDLWEAMGFETRTSIESDSFEEGPANLVILGNQIYNLCAQLYRDDFQFRFEKVAKQDAAGRTSSYRGLFCLPRSAKKREIQEDEDQEFDVPDRFEIWDRTREYEAGVIDRIETKDGNVVVICAGTGSRATKGCALWLARHLDDFTLDLKYRSARDGETQGFPLFFTVAFSRRGGKNPDDGDFPSPGRAFDERVAPIPAGQLLAFAKQSLTK